MEDRRTVQDTHDLSLRRIKNEILALNERLVLLSSADTAAPNNAITSEHQSIRLALLSKIRERINTEDILDLHRSVSTPAHLLPFEIWAQIFSLCMPDIRFPSWDTQFTPVVVGRVCSRWRSMTRLMPELWSSISFDILPGMGNKRPRWMPLIHAFLNRSVHHPLSIQIIWYQSKFEQGLPAFTDYFLDLITSASARWKHLDITVPSEFLRPFLEARLPILETFTIGSDADPPLTLRDVPRLRSVVFSSFYLRPLTWNIPWNQLTELVSKTLLGIEDVKRILHQCPRLQCFQLRVTRSATWYRPVDVIVQNPALVVLPELRRFAMVIRHGDSVFSILDHLECPALEEIRFSGVQSAPIPPTYPTVIQPKPYILALISRSKCTLRKLIFENFPRLNDLEIRDLLTRIPNLTEMAITFNGNDALNDDFKAILADRRARMSRLE